MASSGKQRRIPEPRPTIPRSAAATSAQRGFATEPDGVPEKGQTDWPGVVVAARKAD
jgi:hypothetical protein